MQYQLALYNKRKPGDSNLSGCTEKGGLPKTASIHFVEKAIEIEGEKKIFEILTQDFYLQSIFRKEHTYAALCTLYKMTENEDLKTDMMDFLVQHKDSELNLLNQVECLHLRIIRKILIIYTYPALREKIKDYLKTAPELIIFVHKPSPLKKTFHLELFLHDEYFPRLAQLGESELSTHRDKLEKIENSLEQDFKQARNNLLSDELQICGFESYGLHKHHYAFRNIMNNNNL